MSKKKDSKTPELIAGGGLLASGAMVGENVRQRKYKYDPKKGISGRAVFLAEGGPRSIGGTGHESAAKALAAAYEADHGKGSAKVVYTNDYNTFKKSHNFAEADYKGVYQKKPLSMARFPLSYLASKPTSRKNLFKDIEDFAPDRVITTHPRSTQVAKKIGIGAEQVITDYGVDSEGAKAFWNSGKPTAQYSPTGAVGEKDIPISSVPIDPKNLKSSPRLKELEIRGNDKSSKVLKKVSLNNGKPNVLAMSGSTGIDLDKVVTEALKSKKDFNLIAVTGKSKELRNKLSKIKDPRLIVQGYETNMDKLLSSADLGLLRPHGISSTEAAGKGLPFIPITTSRKSDSWGQWLVGNAKYFSDRSGIPTSVFDEADSIPKNMDSILDNLGDYKNNDLTKNVRRNAAQEVSRYTNQTKAVAQKRPFSNKAIALTAGGALAAGAAAKYLGDKMSPKDLSMWAAGASAGSLGGASSTIYPMIKGTRNISMARGIGEVAALSTIGGQIGYRLSKNQNNKKGIKA